MEEPIESNADVAAEPQYVGFWARLLAAIIDSIWIIIFLTLVMLITFGDATTSIDIENSATPAEMLAQIASKVSARLTLELLLGALLVVVFWCYKSATPGKMVISAYIVDAKTLGTPTTGQLVIRYLGYYVSLLAFCLGFLWVAFDKRKQGWHDKIAGTVVIKK